MSLNALQMAPYRDGAEDDAMTATSNVGPVQFVDTQMPTEECEAVLGRACFGHLAFVRQGHVDVMPTRYAYLDGWIYFRADIELRKLIAASPWLALSVTQLEDPMRVTSVVARGGCYETERTGTALGDASALHGIMELRDRPSAAPERAPRVKRASTVFRLHVDELRGVTATVPCPAGERPYDAVETQHLRDAARQQTAADDARADDDGMAESHPPRPGRSGGVPRTR